MLADLPSSVSIASPSLRGSGLKFSPRMPDQRQQGVSLFTREWIEITRSLCIGCRQSRSPSLRGSGLK